jgi:hypothetical protein
MSNYLKTFLLIWSCLSFSSSFSQQIADTAKANKEALATLNNYIAALKELNVIKAISYCSDSKDFLVYQDGNAMNYEEFTASIRTAFSQIKKAVVHYESVHVRHIAQDAVLITGPFHQTVSDPNDKEYDFEVTASFILLKREGQWKINYATVVSRLITN